MDSKRWLACFLATVLLLGAAVVGFNYWVDPFGVFSHKSLEWPSYEMTINPRTAKITYLKDHHQDYDSYILGCSSTSSFPVESLNSYLDASFYNMIMYGADMLDVEEQAFYLVENYEVKNLVVNVYLDNAKDYNTEPDPLSYAMPPETTGENAGAFLSKYLFMDPRHSLDKLKALRKDTYLTQTFDVFDPVTGAYDKKVRDAEPIGNMDRYLEAYPVFANYPEATNTTNEEAITGTLESLTRIRDLCQENGINLIVLCAPVYADYMDYFSWDQVADFYTRLAQVTPYWDFSYSSVSFEPRYFTTRPTSATAWVRWLWPGYSGMTPCTFPMTSVSMSPRTTSRSTLRTWPRPRLWPHSPIPRRFPCSCTTTSTRRATTPPP